ncbi:MAG: N-acetylneuraminate synthase, partial [Anaerolineales bacterium]|nr:N-acetylneuraminate synthase [Anaerolineales bacterium]
MGEHFRIGKTVVGLEQPTYVVAEIGINHNGDLEIAKRLIDAAHRAGVDAVKFQKRTPELCVP